MVRNDTFGILNSGAPVKSICPSAVLMGERPFAPEDIFRSFDPARLLKAPTCEWRNRQRNR